VLGLSLFFFQAEDGIRDFHVTGVQTCALPISGCRAGRPVDRRTAAVQRGPAQRSRPRARNEREYPVGDPLSALGGGLQPRLWLRSEERRVGKECRDVWLQEDEHSWNKTLTETR